MSVRVGTDQSLRTIAAPIVMLVLAGSIASCGGSETPSDEQAADASPTPTIAQSADASLTTTGDQIADASPTPTVVAGVCPADPLSPPYPAPVPDRIGGFVSYDDGTSVAGVLDAEVQLLDASGSTLLARTKSIACGTDIGYFVFEDSTDLVLANGDYTLMVLIGAGESPSLSGATAISDPDDPAGTSPTTPNTAVVTHPGAYYERFVYGP